MHEQVAFDAIVWLLHASGPSKKVHVTFMGGEPLIQFKMIKKLVPFGKRRAWQMGKELHFGMTTNGTLVTDQVVDFWRKWGLGFHTSIDGTPEVQDRNRPTVSGKGSSRLVEKAVPKILSYRPNTTARSTVVPSSANDMPGAYDYFRKLGYTDIAFVPGGPSEWDRKSIEEFETCFSRVVDCAIKDYRNGTPIRLKGVDEYVKGVVRNRRPKHACGAGRGLVLIDINGSIWPCHRWNKSNEGAWSLGSIYEHFNNEVRRNLDKKSQVDLLEQDCSNCAANTFCGGGCPAENLEETGNVYKRHHNACELTRVVARQGKRMYEIMMKEENDLFRQVYGIEEAVLC